MKTKTIALATELIAGHRRKYACQLAGLVKMPVLVRELDDDEATLAMVNSNNQREKILPSEKAFAYKMMMDAMRRQGKRTDITLAQVGPKSRVHSAEIIASDSGESRNQIKRFIRLTELTPPLLDMVDRNKLPFTVAVELSYLSKEHQDVVLNVISENRAKPSIEQSKQIRELDQAGCLTKQNIIDLLAARKSAKAETNLRLPNDLLTRCFPTYTQEQIVTAILELLEGIAMKTA